MYSRTSIAAALMGIVATTTLATPAQAAVVDRHCDQATWLGTRSPSRSVCLPQPPGTTFVIEGPHYSWGVRTTARYIDRRVRGIQFHTDVTDTCAQYPKAWCIRVVKEDFTPDGSKTNIIGRTDIEAGVIKLNTDFAHSSLRLRRKGVGHELMHALGFSHHQGSGLCIPIIDRLLPTRAELWALRNWYNR